MTGQIPDRQTDKPMSKYLQIRKDITAKITDREWPPGTRIPSEAELASTYQCSRGTVTKALSPLVEDGWIVRRRRAGSFVASVIAPEVAEVFVGLEGAQSEAMGHSLRRRVVMVLRSEELSAAQLAERLQVPMGRLYHHLRILEDVQLIQVTREQRRRGTLQRFFRSASTGGYVIGTMTGEDTRADYRKLFETGLSRLEADLDVERVENDAPELYVMGSVTVHASEESLRELTAFFGQWVQRHIHPRPGLPKVNLTAATFPVVEGAVEGTAQPKGPWEPTEPPAGEDG